MSGTCSGPCIYVTLLLLFKKVLSAKMPNKRKDQIGGVLRMALQIIAVFAVLVGAVPE